MLRFFLNSLVSLQGFPKVQRSTKEWFCALACLALVASLSACGGRGGSAMPPANRAPVAVIAPLPAQLFPGQSLVLDASGSSDDKGLSGYEWSALGLRLPPLPHAVRLTLNLPTDVTPGNYSLRLRVWDAEGVESVVERTLTILAAPVSARPRNLSCLAGEAPASPSGLQLAAAFGGLRFAQPVSLKQAPGGNDWYLAQKTGEIYRFTAAAPSKTLAIDLSALVDDSANEAGLLAIAFDPNFASNRRWYAFYQKMNGTRRQSVLVRFTGFVASSREELIVLTPPYSNHFGGELAFGPDGYLYLSIGDGGSGGDPGNRAQNTTNLFGSLIRIDVSPEAPLPYGIPSDNPFVGGARCTTGSSSQNCPEIYAYGLRNSWRFSFDAPTGQLWLGDVGQDAYEEINLIVKGGNYGWRFKEGTHCFNPSTQCDRPGLIDPVAEIAHPAGESITGGQVYRGRAIPTLAGKYVFSDYRSGVIWALVGDAAGALKPKTLVETGRNIGHFAADEQGELYVLDYASGGIFKLVASGATGTPVPERLSETGCVDPDNPVQKSSGVIPYSINAPFWSDGARKARFVALPDNTQILSNADSWQWPVGSVLIKDFYWQDRLIETRLLKLHTDQSWAGYTYAWNAEQTDATLVTGGKTGAFNNPQWIYPDGPQCLQCHTQAAGRVLGAVPAQLNRPLDANHPLQPAAQNQLLAWAQWQLITANPVLVPPLPDPSDATLPVADRARAYLDSNCSQCHRPNGPTNVDMDLRYEAEFADMALCNVPATENLLALPEPLRLNPGNSDSSLVYRRLIRRDQHAMPPIGSYAVDTAGTQVIQAWIDDLEGCNQPQGVSFSF